MIRAEHLVKTFYRAKEHGRRVDFNAVDDISIEARPGEILGILGPNGAGKTTLLRMLATLMEPTSGQVTVTTDRVLTTPQQIKHEIGYLSGNTKLYQRFSVREMLAFFARVYGMGEEETERRIDQVTDVLDLSAFIDERIGKLSTGQTQRVSIARCIVHNPPIYIFDEPTLGLDIIASSRIIEFMRGEKEKGKTIIYSTHYMEEADYLCDRVAMVSHGKVVCDETPAALEDRTGTQDLRHAFYAVMEENGEEVGDDAAAK